jgi:hypothetical protein
MDRMGDYHGELESVDIRLWRGAYVINNLVITRVGEEVPAPLLKSPETDISIAWRELFNGAIVAEVEFNKPVLWAIDSEDKPVVYGQGVDWMDHLAGLSPIRINEARVNDGEFHFVNFDFQRNVDLYISDITGVMTNLTNVRSLPGKQGGTRVSALGLSGLLLDQAPVSVSSEFAPLNMLGDFDLHLKIVDVDLTAMNDFFKAYAKLDVETGSGDFVMELDTKGRMVRGYAKPLFKDVQIFSWENDVMKPDDSRLSAIWQAIAGTVENLFKNQSENQFATRVEIEGTVGETETSTFEAIINILRNAFVEAFKPSLEGLGPKPVDAPED